MALNALPPLVGVLRGDIGHFAARMGEARAVAAETSSANAAAFRGMAAVGKAAFLGIAGAALVIGGVAIHMAGDFEQSMTQLVTGAGESRANIAMVAEGIKNMAGEVGVSAQDLAKGMYMVESAGFHGAAGLTLMKIAAEGAKVGGADMAVVADALTSALNAYHLPASSAASVTNDLIATVASGKMHMEDLAGALGKVLPAASTAHVSLAEVTAAIATMTMQGTPAADAATYLRQTILQLENPSAKAKKAFEEVGLTSKKVAEDLGKKGLAATLQEITDAISKKFKPGSAEYIAHLANMVGGTKSMQAALELTGGNMAVFRANVAAIGSAAKSGGGSVKGWADVQKDFNFQIEQAKAGAGALAITIGSYLIPYVSKAMVVTGQIVGYFKQHKDQALILGAAIAGPLAVAIGAYTVSMIAAAAATIAATWPVILVVGAIALLSAGLVYAYQHFGWFRDGVNAIGGALRSFVGWIATNVPPAWTAISGGAIAAWDAVSSGVGAIAQTVGAVVGFVTGVPGQIGAFFSRLGTTASKAWQDFASRPIYWIAFIATFIPARLIKLEAELAGRLASMVVSAQKWAADMTGKAIAMATGFVRAIMTEIPKLPGQVGGALVNVALTVGHWRDDMVKRAGSMAGDFQKTIMTELTQLPGQLTTLGVDIVKGLIAGFLQMKDAAGKALHQVVQGAVDGVKSGFGIHSPSTWMIEHVGKPLGQGVTAGVLGQMGNATSAMRTLVGATAGASTGATVNASSGGVGLGPSSRIESLLQRIADAIEGDDSSQQLSLTNRHLGRLVAAGGGGSGEMGVEAKLYNAIGSARYNQSRGIRGR